MPIEAETKTSCVPSTIGCASIASKPIRRARRVLLGRDAVQQHDELVAALAAYVAVGLLAVASGRRYRPGADRA